MSDEFQEIVRIPAFDKDIKHLRKRFHTLDEDLERGDISQEAYDELKGNYKAEAIRIMKELDKGQ